MQSSIITREKMWAKQQIGSGDVDYNLWQKQKETLRHLSNISKTCTFTVDVFKSIYDFASDGFSDIFGFSLSEIRSIEEQGDLLEERIHPEDRLELIKTQIKLSHFIYSLPAEERNNYRNYFQFRMLNAQKKYVNVTSRQQVLLKDRNKKAWIVMGMMDISADQTPYDKIHYSVLNLTSGKILIPSTLFSSEASLHSSLTERETEVLQLINRGFLSKEIANQLKISIHTVNNHRKNILRKLEVDNVIEAINKVKENRILL
ncbi:MAG: LuxR C-terminal-related transcriptional regulator [Bacteroides sp.]|nr:LuxR C-terminal-related transcriptional regulator [Bacteroides sp.]